MKPLLARASTVLVSALLVAACGTSQSSSNTMSQASVDRLAREARMAQAASPTEAPAGADIFVRLDQDLGPGISPDNNLFTARLTMPLTDRRGIVLAPKGALVHGHVVHVDEGQRRVELAFDRLETRDGVYDLKATIVSAKPYALTVAPEGQPTSNTAVLEQVGPTAVGGGPVPPPSEADELAPRGVAIVPFDAELHLKLVGPVTSAMQ
jgi:hypothetical protein